MDLAESPVERIEARGRTNLENRDFHGLCAQRPQAVAQLAGLMRSAGDEDAAASERQHRR
jgi:hypothetical protein